MTDSEKLKLRQTITRLEKENQKLKTTNRNYLIAASLLLIPALYNLFKDFFNS